MVLSCMRMRESWSRPACSYISVAWAAALESLPAGLTAERLWSEWCSGGASWISLTNAPTAASGSASIPAAVTHHHP